MVQVKSLGIVGHGAEKFTASTEASAKEEIRRAIVKLNPIRIVSGRSPIGGIDVWAEKIAHEMDRKTLIFPPKIHSWGAPGGYRDRNLQIANISDLVLVIVVKDYPPGYRGMRFDSCYHCQTTEHVKSGGCWTAWKCQRQEWRIIS